MATSTGLAATTTSHRLRESGPAGPLFVCHPDYSGSTLPGLSGTAYRFCHKPGAANGRKFAAFSRTNLALLAANLQSTTGRRQPA